VTPIAYYASFLRYHLPGTTNFNFFHFWWHTLTIGPWPSGSAWFLWVSFPAFVKFAIVFTGTLSMSWALTVLLRKIPVVARTI
jgi:hypothetical protein